MKELLRIKADFLFWSFFSLYWIMNLIFWWILKNLSSFNNIFFKIKLIFHFREFFCLHINNNYNNLILTNKTMEFLLRNKEILYKMTNVYNEYYPNIFRMLIWSPLQLKENVY